MNNEEIIKLQKKILMCCLKGDPSDLGTKILQKY